MRLPANESRREQLLRYAAAAAIAPIALGLVQLASTRFFFIIPTAAVALAAILGGRWPALACIPVYVAGLAFFFLSRGGSLAVADPQERKGLLLFAGTAVMVAFAGGSVERARRKLASLYHAEKRANARIARFHEFTATLASTRTEEEVVNAMLREGLAAFGAYAGAFVVPANGEQLALVASRGYSGPLGEEWQLFSVRLPMPMPDALRSRAPVWVHSRADADARYPLLGRSSMQFGTHAWAAIPLITADTCLGVLGLSFDSPREFEDGERGAMVTLATKCAQALDRVRLFEKEQEARQRAQALAAELERERARIQAVLDQMPAGVLVADRLGKLRTRNEEAERILGQPFPMSEDAQSCSQWRCFHPDGRPVETHEHVLPRALASGETVKDEIILARSDGTRATLCVSAAPIRAPGSSIEGAVVVAWDITEQKAAEQALRDTTLALEEAARQKDHFLAMLAHELRNPLAAIRNAASVIRLRLARGQSAEGPLEILERQVSNSARLLDDLFDVSRVTRGIVQIQKERVRIEHVIASAVESQAPLIDTLRHHLTVTYPREPVYLDGDPTRLEQVVANLLNNAAKYTPRGGRIAIVVETEADHARIRVTDTGSGMPATVLPHLFELFFQGEPSSMRASGGLGIGLTLVRKLVEMHGGTIEARSDGIGRGSEFTVRLPKASPPEAPSSEAARVARVGQQRRRILVVEDNADAAEMLGEHLAASGHDVQVAPDGPAALELARRFTPEVVLLDIGLPGMDGYEVARRLRERTSGPNPALVALTGYGQEQDRARTREAGFDRHLTKPVGPEDIERVLGEL